MGSVRSTVTTTDGRELEVMTAGQSTGYPWLWIPGSPSAVADYPRIDALASKLDLRMVTWSRPGYGGSSPRPSHRQRPRIVDDVPDIVAIVNELEITEFIVVGWSGGGPRALACAAMLPDRCRAAATLASLAPFDAEGLEWMADMGPGNVVAFTAAFEGPDVYGEFQRTYFLPMTSAGADDVAAGLDGLLTPTDDRASTQELAEWLAEMMHHAGAQGIVGARDDGLALVGSWGFDVRNIAGPVAVWAGGQDATVPFAHGKWLAEHIPGSIPHLFDDAGHITLVNDLEAVLRELLQLT